MFSVCVVFLLILDTVIVRSGSIVGDGDNCTLPRRSVIIFSSQFTSVYDRHLNERHSGTLESTEIRFQLRLLSGACWAGLWSRNQSQESSESEFWPGVVISNSGHVLFLNCTLRLVGRYYAVLVSVQFLSVVLPQACVSRYHFIASLKCTLLCTFIRKI